MNLSPEAVTVIVGVLSSGGLAGLYATWRSARTQDQKLVQEGLASAQQAHASATQAFELSLMKSVQDYQAELSRISEVHRIELAECRNGHAVEIEKRIVLIERMAYLEGQLKAMPMVPISFASGQVHVSAPAAPSQA